MGTHALRHRGRVDLGVHPRELRQGDLLRGTSLRPVPTRGDGQGRALDRHPRRRSRRGADGRVGEAGGRNTGLGPSQTTVSKWHSLEDPERPNTGASRSVRRPCGSADSAFWSRVPPVTRHLLSLTPAGAMTGEFFSKFFQMQPEEP